MAKAGILPRLRRGRAFAIEPNIHCSLLSRFPYSVYFVNVNANVDVRAEVEVEVEVEVSIEGLIAVD